MISAEDGGAVVVDGGVAIVRGPPGPAGPPAIAAWGESAPSFAGFTVARTPGFAGGRHQMHARCLAEFPRSHMCHYSEYLMANPRLQIPSPGAWIDWSAGPPSSFEPPVSQSPVSRNAGRFVGAQHNCLNWTSNPSGTGSGAALSVWPHDLVPCVNQLSVACCNSPYREQFAGVTTATTDGNAGGIEGMNRRCHMEYPNSHFCSFSEFQRAAVPIAVPSVWMQPNFSMQISPEDNPPAMTTAPTCSGWSSASSTGTNYVATLSNPVSTTSCAVQLPLACCL